ncbi:glycosyltransferase [Chitinibacter sp. SCUT-21]|uniref:glycosyltransferase n=1 Tax=Chitinibacter sp. SCUT-21 TaxID=2970891 RepID=UPI0035A6AF2B
MSCDFSLPRVAILLAVFNGEENIVEQIASLATQKHVRVKIFFSDDGSIDRSVEVISSRVSCDFEILPSMRSGCAGANFFRLIRDVNFSEFDYVAFADQDDIWDENKLIRAISALDEYKTDVYSSNVTAFWPDGRQMLINKAQSQKKWDHYFEAAGPGCTYVMPVLIASQLKKMIIDNVSEMKEIALHDWFIYAWARHNGLRWFIDPVPSMRYRQHAANVVGVNNGVSAAKSRFNKLRDGWYLNQIKLIASSIDALDVPPICWVANPSLLNKFKLILSVAKCRRRFRDRLGFIVFVMMLRKYE